MLQLSPEHRKSIVLAADLDFETQLLTTIKSICAHNKHVDFYLFNNNFPNEWFDNLNGKLERINCKIKNIKIIRDELKSFPTYQHIQSETTFYRYFIADLVEAEKALYLDADLVVTGSLDPFFDIELDTKPIAACIDELGLFVGGEKGFNAGVLLVNIPVWKQKGVSNLAMHLSNLIIDKVSSADQSILNILFKNDWLELKNYFNYLVGFENLLKTNNLSVLITRKENEVPLIVHYNTSNKPWKELYDLPLREQYWYYHNLEWNDIYLRHSIS